MKKAEYIEKCLTKVHYDKLNMDIYVSGNCFISLAIIADDMENTHDLVSILAENNITTGISHLWMPIDDEGDWNEYPVANIGYSPENETWYIWTPDKQFFGFKKGDKIRSMKDIAYMPSSKEDHMEWIHMLYADENQNSVVTISEVRDKTFDLQIIDPVENGNSEGVTVGTTRYYTINFYDDYSNKLSTGFTAENGDDARKMAIQAYKNLIGC